MISFWFPVLKVCSFGLPLLVSYKFWALNVLYKYHPYHKFQKFICYLLTLFYLFFVKYFCVWLTLRICVAGQVQVFDFHLLFTIVFQPCLVILFYVVKIFCFEHMMLRSFQTFVHSFLHSIFSPKWVQELDFSISGAFYCSIALRECRFWLRVIYIIPKITFHLSQTDRLVLFLFFCRFRLRLQSNRSYFLAICQICFCILFSTCLISFNWWKENILWFNWQRRRIRNRLQFIWKLF